MKKDDPLDAALEQPAGYGLLKKLEQRLLLWNYQRLAATCILFIASGYSKEQQRDVIHPSQTWFIFFMKYFFIIKME